MSTAAEEVRSREVEILLLVRQRVVRGMSTPQEEQAIDDLERALAWARAEMVWAESQLADQERDRKRQELLG